MPDLQLRGKVIITGYIKAKTGLHIGSSQGRVDIGGVDHLVIRDPEGKPYIPGSSLKGKLRSLLEIEKCLAVDKERVKTRGGETEITMHLCNRSDCPVCLLFGRHNDKFLERANKAKSVCSLADPEPAKDCPNERKDVDTRACPYLCINNTTPTRLLVRDAYLDEDSFTEERKKNLANEWTEEKMENSIDRITSAANPRTLERVPKGARFEFQIILTLLQESDRNLLAALILAMQLLEDDYLGAWGSRGSGQVCFEDVQIFWNSRQDYETGPIDLSQKQAVLNKLFPHLTYLREQQSGVIAALS